MQEENPDPPGKDKKKPDSPLSFIGFSFRELGNGVGYAFGQAAGMLFGNSEGKDGYHITSKHKVGPEPELEKGSDYEIIDDPTNSMLDSAVSKTIFGDGSMEVVEGYYDPESQSGYFGRYGNEKSVAQIPSQDGDSLTYVRTLDDGIKVKNTVVMKRPSGLINSFGSPIATYSSKHVKKKQ
jgi:hypothetical protein